MGGFRVERGKEMASKIWIRDGLPPHGDGTPHRICSGVSKTRGGERQQRCSFLQLLVFNESPQSKTHWNFCKIKRWRANKVTSLPFSPSRSAGRDPWTATSPTGSWTFSFQSVEIFQNKNIKNKSKTPVRKIKNTLYRSTVILFFQAISSGQKSSSAVAFTLTLDNLPSIKRVRADERSHLEVSYPPCKKQGQKIRQQENKKTALWFE